jgi:hypothetical protein
MYMKTMRQLLVRMKKAVRPVKCLLLVMAGSICFASCDIIEDLFGKDEKDEGKGLSNKEIARIREDYETIDLTAQEVVSKDVIDKEQVSALIEEYRQLESVEDAWLDVNGIVVKFKKYGLAFWTYPHEFINPPFFDIDRLEAQVRQIRSQILATRAGEAKILPENNKVGIFCGLSRDNNEAPTVGVFDKLGLDLESAGYKVYPYYQEDFTIEAFKAGLKEFGTIIIGTHGNLTGGRVDGKWTEIPPRMSTPPEQHVWFRTGETYKAEKYEDDIQNERVSQTRMFSFNEKLIEDYFDNNTLPNTLFYTLSCWGMHDNILGKVMEKKRKGEGVTIGYDDSNSIGHATAWILFEALLGGYTVKEAYDVILPLDCKEHSEFRNNRGAYITYLDYYPKSGGNVSLANDKALGDLIVQSPAYDPAYGKEYYDRVILLKGICRGFDKNVTGTVSIGDYLTMPLNFINDSTFSQNIEIKAGDNIIKIVCSGNAKGSSVPLIVNKEIWVVGTFDQLPLYTAMQWNTAGTDVDLHLEGPNGTDCYFRNKQPSWGGILDIDKVDGFGPEHITIPVLKQTGTYKLYAHYYDPKGKGPSFVQVQVETLTGKETFGPHLLTQKGESWQICEIIFRSLTPPYGATINYTNLRVGEESSIFENLPPKKE